MKQRTKIAIALPILIAIVSSFLTIDQVSANGTFGITSIDSNPNPLVTGDNMTVTVLFSDTSNIYSVQLLICTLTPEFLCESPVDMIEIDTGIYRGIFQIEYEVGTTVGYHIKIVYDNGTSPITIPETPDFLDMDIVEPLTDFFYFDAGTVQEKSDEAGCCGVLGTILAIGTTSLIARKKKSVKK